MIANADLRASVVWWLSGPVRSVTVSMAGWPPFCCMKSWFRHARAVLSLV